MHFRVFGQSIVILGSVKAIRELLEKRSTRTSHRKQSPMIKLLVSIPSLRDGHCVRSGLTIFHNANRSGSQLNIAQMPYSQTWRDHRRALWQYFHRDASASYRPIQRSSTHILLDSLLKDPHGLAKHIRASVYFLSLVLRENFGSVITKGDGNGYLERVIRYPCG